MLDDLLDIEAAAPAAGVATKTLRRAIAGGLPAVQIGGKWFLARSVVESLPSARNSLAAGEVRDPRSANRPNAAAPSAFTLAAKDPTR